MVAGGLAAIAFHTMRPEATGLFLTPGLALAAGVAGVALHATNLLLLFGMITLIKGGAFWRTWKDAWTLDAVQEAALLALGLVGALVMSQAAWGLIVLLIPFVLGYYGFRRSVEEARQKAELAEELEHKLIELKQAQAQLIQSAKMASVGTLAAGVAHEINNPTFAITGRAEMFLYALSKADDAYLRSQMAVEDMETILNEGMRISTIVKHLLGYARSSDGEAEVRLDEAIVGAAQMLGGKASSKGVDVILDCGGKPTVLAVKNQMEQVFVNLLNNALDATPARGTITLGCAVEGATATAYVNDTGAGMPQEVQERVFEPFFTTKDIGQGTGLGLFICHKIVTDLDGEMSVSSESGSGTMVSVRLPVVAGAVESHAESARVAVAA